MINDRFPKNVLVILVFVSGSVAWTVQAESRKKPNLLVIMADDLGYADLSAYGARDIRTPNIDSLMARGVRFTDFTANSAVCSPSRASFMTGRYPDTAGIPGTMYGDSRGFMDPKMVALPQVLKDNGYRTSLVGKWCLSGQEPNRPNDRGFDDFRGMVHGGIKDYWAHEMRGKINMYHNYQRLTDTVGIHATELFTGWAIKEIEKAKVDDRPFFLFLSHYAPHGPLQPPEKALSRFRERNPDAPEQRALLGALIEDLDYHIGLVLDTLEKLELGENTLVFFLSDNGGSLGHASDNGGFRGGKTCVYEGGLRVCASLTWPGVVKGGVVSALSGMTMDVFPTLLEAAGITHEGKLDGRSLLKPLQEGVKSFPDRTQIYCYHHTSPAKKKYAVRKGDWKLVREFTDGPYELYNLADDPGETNNLASAHSERCSELGKILQRHLDSVVPFIEIRSKYHQSMRE